MTLIYILLAVVVLIILWLVASYNGFVRLINRTKEAWADIDVQLKRRYDLIPNLVETVKGYASHESVAYFIYEGKFDREYVGDFPTEMFEHWMKSFAEHAGMNLNLKIIDGSNTHHMIEASFKALAKSIKQAIQITGTELPSTKGVL